MRRLVNAFLCLPLMAGCGHRPPPDPITIPIPTREKPPEALVWDCEILPFETIGDQLTSWRSALQCEHDNNAALRIWSGNEKLERNE